MKWNHKTLRKWEQMSKWHKWFAWYPLSDGNIIWWLENVKRRNISGWYEYKNFSINRDISSSNIKTR